MAGALGTPVASLREGTALESGAEPDGPDAARARLRALIGLLLAGAIAFVLRDLWRRPPNLEWLLAIKGLQLALLCSFPWILHPKRERSRPGIAVGMLTLYCATVVATGVLRAEASGTILSLISILLASAAAMEWGPRAQGCFAVLVLSGWAVTAATAGDARGIIDLNGAEIVIAALTSIYVAHVLAQMRRAVAERQAALADNARMAQESEQTLRESENRYRILVEQSSDLICQLDQSGTFLYLSPNYATQLGYAPPELIGRSAVEFVHPDDIASVAGAIAEFRGGRHEFRFRHKDGAWRWFESHSRVCADARGLPSAVVISRDITERKQVEDALAQSELRHRLATRATSDSIWDWDLRSDGVVRNDAIQAYFGHAPQSVRADAAWWLEQIHPEDRERVRASLDGVLRGDGADWREEYRFRRGDGDYAFVVDRGSVMRDENGRPVRMVGAMSDETPRKQAEERLQRSEAHFRSLIEQGSDLISIVDAKAIIRYASPSHFSVLGYRPEELVGRTLAEFVCVDDSAGNAGSIASESGRAVEFRFRHANGSWRVLESRIADYSASGFGGVVANSRDVTDRRQAEADLQRAKNAAEAASRVKSEFLANMSHEIRTPMNAILGMTDLALGTELDGEQRGYLETVRTAGDWLMTLINDVLDFSKLESGKVTLDLVDFDLRWALAETLRILGPRAREKGLELGATVAPDVPDIVVGDPGRLRQVLVNLIGNGIKFTDAGRVDVHVGRGNGGDDDAIELGICVRDTGIGIAADKQQAIFEPFEQADSSTTRRHGGTGLGLAISKQLVAAMNGRMWLDSEPGRGSAFHFVVRLRRAGSAARPPAHTSPALAAAGPGLVRLIGRSLRVLLAEDNAVNQRLAVVLLEKHGHRITAVGTGRDAVAALRREPFDVVLMDVQMPEMDGLEASRVIRDLEAAGELACGRVPIIAMTAHALAGDRERCLAAGMDGYVSKPIRAAQLLDAIGHVVSTLGAPEIDAPARAVAS